MSAIDADMQRRIDHSRNPNVIDFAGADSMSAAQKKTIAKLHGALGTNHDNPDRVRIERITKDKKGNVFVHIARKPGVQLDPGTHAMKTGAFKVSAAGDIASKPSAVGAGHVDVYKIKTGRAGQALDAVSSTSPVAPTAKRSGESKSAGSVQTGARGGKYILTKSGQKFYVTASGGKARVSNIN